MSYLFESTWVFEMTPACSLLVGFIENTVLDRKARCELSSEKEQEQLVGQRDDRLASPGPCGT
jgi:hypothetical protein